MQFTLESRNNESQLDKEAEINLHSLALYSPWTDQDEIYGFQELVDPEVITPPGE